MFILLTFFRQRNIYCTQRRDPRGDIVRACRGVLVPRRDKAFCGHTLPWPSDCGNIWVSAIGAIGRVPCWRADVRNVSRIPFQVPRRGWQRARSCGCWTSPRWPWGDWDLITFCSRVLHFLIRDIHLSIHLPDEVCAWLYTSSGRFRVASFPHVYSCGDARIFLDSTKGGKDS